MNLYIRYFEQETVVESYDDAIEFLKSIPDINVDKYIKDDLYAYLKSDMPYPKRYKTHQRCYFIVIKTMAKSLDEFKANAHNNQPVASQVQSEKDYQLTIINKELPGWYEVSLMFRRVITDPDTGKCGYRDTDFVVRLKGMSIRDCYDHVIDYLKSREDIDPRSQFPSIKNRNFTCTYLGLEQNA